MRFAVLAFVLVALGCGPPVSVVDAGQPDAAVTDAGPQVDGGTDAGPEDAGEDGGAADAGGDAGAGDDGGLDAGAPDAGGQDAGPDAGPADGGTDAGFDAGAPDGGFACPVPSGVGPAFRLRAMAANLTSGNLQSYDPGHGARIMQGADPDIVMIQEFNYGTNTVAELNDFVSATFGGEFSWQRGAGMIPNGVISRWPFLSQGEWVDPSVNNRAFTWARVDLPGPNELWVVSVHLLTSGAGARNTEAAALVGRFQANIPPGDYLLVGGDFNTDTRAEVCFTTLAPRLIVTGPYPADQNANDATNTTRTKPYDHVLASPCLSALRTATVIGASVYDAGLVVDTRVYTPLSEITPALLSDSAATAMQHMAVVKDFLIQP